MANVTVRVVIRVLSAAGSRMVPRTERISKRLARYPSAFLKAQFLDNLAIRVLPTKSDNPA